MPAPQIRTLYELGRGGMGAVDLVEQRDEAGATLAARKRMLPELLRDPRARAMFLKEARLLARIDHPNVVKTLGIDPGDDERPPSQLLEYVNGVTLGSLLERAGSGLSIPVACRIAHDVALGLHAAHELRDEEGKPLVVVHRDVSPHNVVVTFDGATKLLDFGVAKTDEGTRTQTGEVRGKVAYMAPEQALAEAVDRRSDVYSLGAVLYELLTGKRMHGHGTDLEILKRMATSTPPRPRAVRPEIPEALEALVLSMTAEARDGRPATAGDVAQALAPFARDAQRVDLAALVRGLFPGAETTSTTRAAEALEGARPREPKRAVGPRSLVAVAAAALLSGGVAWVAWPSAHHATRTASVPPPSAAVTEALPAASSVPSIAPAATASSIASPRAVVASPPKTIPTAPRAAAAPRVDEKPF